MTRLDRRRALGLGLAGLAAPCLPPNAHAAAAPAAWRSPERDVIVLDQAGQRARLFADLVAPGPVLVDFIFASCSSICPILTATTLQLRETLRTADGRSPDLLSITVDPLHDTPDVLARYAARFEAPPGWRLLRASAADLPLVQAAFAERPGAPAGHGTRLSMVDAKAGRWVQIEALASEAELIAAARALWPAPA